MIISFLLGMYHMQNGRRSSLQLDLMYYSNTNDEVHQIGKWEKGKGVNVYKNSTNFGFNKDKKDHVWDGDKDSLDFIFQQDSVDPVTLVVVTKEEQPYVMLREGKTGNDAYDGFCIDLLKVIKPELLNIVICNYMKLISFKSILR